MQETVEIRRKRLRFRSWHRGTRELDLLLGRFADRYVDGLTPDQLDRYEALIEEPEPDIYRWISGGEPVPPKHDDDVMALIKSIEIKVE